MSQTRTPKIALSKAFLELFAIKNIPYPGGKHKLL